jgi:hypothetical protein
VVRDTLERRRGGQGGVVQSFAGARFGWPLSGRGAATGLAGAVAFGSYHFWDAKFGHATLGPRIGAVFLPSAAAGLIYGSVAVLAKIPAATEMMSLISRKLHK